MDWKGMLKTVAPILGSAVGGPFGGTALKFLADNLLGNPDATEDQVAQYIETASPEQLVTLRGLDNDFKTKMRELGIREQELTYKDRSDARQLFIKNIWPQVALSGVFIVGYFVILYAIMTNQTGSSLDTDLKLLVAGLVGVITSEVPRIMAFWFGSSLGSKEKTAIAAKGAAA